jgi:hypothetical protein
MRYPKDQGQQTRRRIVENASYGLRQTGADGLSDARQAAAGAIATTVGSIVLARASGDKRLSDALLEAGRQAVRNQTGSTTAESSSGPNLSSSFRIHQPPGQLRRIERQII